MPLLSFSTFIILTLLLFSLKAAKYTISRSSRTQTGIGWSEEGIIKFNELLDQVEHDRQERGGVFLHSFFMSFVTAKQVTNDDSTKMKKVKVKAKTNLKRKWNPEENLDDFNESAEMEEV